MNAEQLDELTTHDFTLIVLAAILELQTLNIKPTFACIFNRVHPLLDDQSSKRSRRIDRALQRLCKARKIEFSRKDGWSILTVLNIDYCEPEIEKHESTN